MKKFYLIAMLFLFAGMSNSVMAQTADHSVARDNTKNQVLLTFARGIEKYYNTADVESIDFEGYEITVRLKDNAGNDVFKDNVTGISFFKAEKPAGPTKADLIGTWEIKYLDEQAQERGYIFTEDKLTLIGVDEKPIVVPYTFENGIVTYTVPATDWNDAYTVSKSVILLYDNSVLVLKNKPEGWEEGLEDAELFFKKDKKPETSGANLNGKWFAYHRGSKQEVRLGLTIDGDKAELIIGGWAIRIICPYTYENGIITLHPKREDYNSSRDEEHDWGYGCMNPATLESPWWTPNFSWPTIDNIPLSFMFIVNGDEAYSWYTNLPCLFYKQ